jgi:hypothetical protein
MAEHHEAARPVEVGRFFSGARNVKQLLGTFPDGTRIPGGPYTLSQFFVLLAVLIGGWITRPLWSIDLLSDLIVLGAAAFGLALLAGKLPGGRRNPVRMLTGAYGLLVRPRSGLYRGRPMKTTFAKPAARRRPQVDAASGGQEMAAEASPTTTTAARNFSSLDLLRADLGMDY